MEKGSKPTHRLRVRVAALDGSNAPSATIGAAWQREDGSFLIKLDPCVVIRWDDAVVIGLFPVLPGEKTRV